MFEKLDQFAEQAATNLSRRAFLGRVARLAGGMALVLGGVCATASSAWAAGSKMHV